MMSRQPDNSFTPVYYRWNPDKGYWEYWNPSYEHWRPSTAYDAKESCGPNSTSILVVVEYEDTWCEPFEGMEEE
jgi:hypothetical protein